MPQGKKTSCLHPENDIIITYSMSALSILYLVLPFPIAFILHDAEEAIVQQRWMLSHRHVLENRFPRLQCLFEYLSALNTQSFVIAAIEELVILILLTCYVLIQGNYCMQLWAALFIAFSIHLLLHIQQAIILRCYVPGLFTSLLLIPYSYLGIQSIWYAMNGVELLFWSMAGVLFMIINLIIAHWIGKKVWQTLH